MTEAFYERLTDTCHNLLLSNNKLLSYLKNNRYLDEDTIRDYRIGAFPRDLRVLFRHIHPKELKEYSIIWNADRSPFKLYPLVIPILNTKGRAVAIGCRTLMGKLKRDRLGIPKYRNSVYEKSLYLYGLYQAANTIKKEDCVYVVEGYFDAIMAHQCGIKNVVATCGTLFTAKQYVILSRYTDNIYLLFDNDEAGHTSAGRASKKLNKSCLDVDVECLFTPEGYKDLDEYLKKGGNFDAITNKCKQAVNF